MKKISVIGSLNVDMTSRVARFPQPGETVPGEEFHVAFGGKGANQAVAARLLGGNVAMAGRLGDDLYGSGYLHRLQELGVLTDDVEQVPGTATGTAAITVSAAGENTIIVTPGANGLVDRAYIDRIRPRLLQSGIVLLQLEIPPDTVEYAARLLRAEDRMVILDPAPAENWRESMAGCADCLTPNRTEARILTGVDAHCPEDYFRAGRILLEQGAKIAIVKAGADGAYVVTQEIQEHISTFPVQAVDSTGAGDTFNAALAVSLARGAGVRESVRFACAAGALSTQGHGAQGAMPNEKEVLALEKKRTNVHNR